MNNLVFTNTKPFQTIEITYFLLYLIQTTQFENKNLKEFELNRKYLLLKFSWDSLNIRIESAIYTTINWFNFINNWMEWLIMWIDNMYSK